MQLSFMVFAFTSFEPLLVGGVADLRSQFDLFAKAGLFESRPGKKTELYHSVDAEEQHLYQLRMCNAYAHDKPLEMRRVQAPQLIEYPLPYKECHDYTLPLKSGDELKFSSAEHVVGTFIVRELPKPGTLLLVVPHRRDQNSSALTFNSHVFAGGSTQVAIVDAFSGAANASAASLKESSSPPAAFVRLIDAGDISNNNNNMTVSLRQGSSKRKPRKQDLRFNSVVELKPGAYQLALGASNKSSSQVTFNAAANMAYVAIRVGLDDGQSKQFPEELLVFPRTVLLDTDAQNSAASLPSTFSWVTSLLVALILFTVP